MRSTKRMCRSICTLVARWPCRGARHPVIPAPSSCVLAGVDVVVSEPQPWSVESVGLWVCSYGAEAGLAACQWLVY